MRLSIILSPTAISTGIHGLGLALRLLFMMVLVRESTPAVLGMFGLLTAIDLIVIYAAGFELHTFSTRRYARHPTPSQLRICFALHTRVFRFATPLAALVAMAAAWLFDVNLDVTSYLCFGLVVATGTVVQELSRYLVLTAKPIRSIVTSFLRTAGWMPFALLFIGNEQQTMRNITVAWAIASTLAALWGMHALREAFSRHLRIRTRFALHAFSRSASYYAVATAAVLQSNIERFLLQLMLGPTAVGIYSLFVTLANTLTALVQAGVLNIFLPRLLTAFGGLTADRRAVLREACKRALLVCLAMAVAIMIASVPIVKLTDHSAYLEYLWILPALLVGQTVLMWSQPVHLAIYGAHHDRLLLTITVTSLVVSLAVSSVLIHVAGIAGAAAAPVLVSAGMAYARWRAFARLEARGVA